MGRNVSRFTAGKFHFDAMKIITLFSIKVFISILNVLTVTIPFFLYIFSGLFQEINNKNFLLRPEREGEFQVVNFSKPWHQETWKQQNSQKEKPKLNVSTLKSLNVNN